MGSSRRRATFATLTGSGANTLIVSIQALVLIPLYLQALGPRLYGTWLGSGDILAWLYAFDLGLPNLMIQRIGAAHGRGDARSVAEYFATGLVAMAGVALGIALAAVVLAFPLPGWLGLMGSEANTLRWCFIAGAIATAFNIFNNSVVGLSRGIQDTSLMNGALLISSLAGFAVSLALILTGWGLWAIPLGLVARSGVSLAGSLIFVITALRRDRLYRFLQVRRPILGEFLIISPVTALGGLSYALMTQSEAALVAFLVRPELAVVLILTRKAADVARSLVDMIGVATYGSFAHLVTSEQRHRAWPVYGEIISFWLSLAVALASAYMAINSSLVSLWVGSTHYGGVWLTILMAGQLIVTGGSYLLNYLYRATGPVTRGSLALIGEGALRVSLMIGLLSWLGLPGIPIAGIITGLIFGGLAYRWTRQALAPLAEPGPNLSRRLWAGRLAIFSAGMLACLLVRSESWGYVLIVGSAITVIGAATLIYLDPILNTKIASLFWISQRQKILQGKATKMLRRRVF